MTTIPQERFTDKLYQILEETFEQAHGIYLDRGISLQKVLAGMTSEQASRPVSPRGTTVAAHTAHALFFLEVLEQVLRDEDVPKIDWETSWRVKRVTPAEWGRLQAEIQAAYHRILARMRGFASWDGGNPISGALAILAHTAYHIGAIRLAADIVAPTAPLSEGVSDEGWRVAGMMIRPYEEADEQEIVALWRACGLVVPWNDPHQEIRRKLGVQRHLFLVGRLDGVIVATVMAGYEGRRGWLNDLAVAPDRQRRGLGREIVAAAEAEMAKMGCPKVNLQVRAANRAVIAFYERLGYAVEDVTSLGKRIGPP